MKTIKKSNTVCVKLIFELYSDIFVQRTFLDCCDALGSVHNWKSTLILLFYERLSADMYETVLGMYSAT